MHIQTMKNKILHTMADICQDNTSYCNKEVFNIIKKQLQIKKQVNQMQFFRQAVEDNFLTKEWIGKYTHSSQNISSNTWHELIEQHEIERINYTNRKLDTNKDLLSLAIMQQIKVSSPIPISTSEIIKQLKNIWSTRSWIYARRLQHLLQEEKIIKYGSNNGTIYGLNGIVPLIKEEIPLRNKLNVIMAAFVAMSVRVEAGKDIKEEIIQMGKNIQSVMENIIPLSMEANANEMRTKHTNNRSSPRIRK